MVMIPRLEQGQTVTGTLPGPAALAVTSIHFQGTRIEVVRDDRGAWVSVRHVCEALGIAVKRQLPKLRNKPWATVTLMVTVGADRRSREHAMLHLDGFAMWLATIEPARVRPELRERLVLFQIGAAAAVRDHFFGGPSLPAPVPVTPIGRPRRQAPPSNLRGLIVMAGGRTAAARTLGVARSTISRWLSGETRPSADDIERLGGTPEYAAPRPSLPEVPAPPQLPEAGEWNDPCPRRTAAAAMALGEGIPPHAVALVFAMPADLTRSTFHWGCEMARAALRLH